MAYRPPSTIWVGRGGSDCFQRNHIKDKRKKGPTVADIQVSGETLRSGAKDTDAVAAGVAQARDASGAALADNAFGIMCSPLFLPAYTLVKTAADLMMASAEQGLRNSATALRGTATALEGADSDSAAGARRLGA